jgi:hypothetical protein
MTTRRIDALAAQSCIDARHVKGTKSSYNSKIKCLVRYLEETYPESLTNDETNKIRLPLPFETIKCFFGWLSTNTDLPKKKRTEEDVHSDGEEVEEEDDDNSDDEDAAIDHTAAEDVEAVQGAAGEAHGSSSQEASSAGPSMDMFNDNEQTISSSCMGGYKSALKTYCEDHNSPLDADTERWLNTFVRGYKKKVIVFIVLDVILRVANEVKCAPSNVI